VTHRSASDSFTTLALYKCIYLLTYLHPYSSHLPLCKNSARSKLAKTLQYFLKNKLDKFWAYQVLIFCYKRTSTKIGN